jgi:tRNA pseudouridine38-40 synthase
VSARATNSLDTDPAAGAPPTAGGAAAQREPGDAATPDRQIRLRLHYDGGAFAGWQVQPTRRTVQAELERALERLTGARIRATAAGRTDTGVHATGQVVGVSVPAKWTPAELRRALNAVLARDVWVADAVAVDTGFHARYDAIARGYVYRVGTADISGSPFLRRWCWPLGEALDVAVLNDAARRFTGNHSFAAFAKTGQPQRGERCIVHRAEWTAREPAGVTFRVVANRFLHHMVRYMVGTMVDVAKGRRDAADIDRMLAGSAGTTTSPPAPSSGLYLTRVYYEGDDWSAEDRDEILS